MHKIGFGLTVWTKSVGDKIEPWGTPQIRLPGAERKLPVFTTNLLFVKNDLNQFKTTPPQSHMRRQTRNENLLINSIEGRWQV